MLVLVVRWYQKPLAHDSVSGMFSLNVRALWFFLMDTVFF